MEGYGFLYEVEVGCTSVSPRFKEAKLLLSSLGIHEINDVLDVSSNLLENKKGSLEKAIVSFTVFVILLVVWVLYCTEFNLILLFPDEIVPTVF